MRKPLKFALRALGLPALLLADLAPEAPLGLGFVREAAAIIGAPLTPVSAAGVARRTTRRVVAVEATAATAATASATAAAAQPKPPPAPPPAPAGARCRSEPSCTRFRPAAPDADRRRRVL